MEDNPNNTTSIEFSHLDIPSVGIIVVRGMSSEMFMELLKDMDNVAAKNPEVRRAFQNVPIILCSEDVSIESFPELVMNKYGWFRKKMKARLRRRGKKNDEQ